MGQVWEPCNYYILVEYDFGKVMHVRNIFFILEVMGGVTLESSYSDKPSVLRSPLFNSSSNQCLQLTLLCYECNANGTFTVQLSRGGLMKDEEASKVIFGAQFMGVHDIDLPAGVYYIDFISESNVGDIMIYSVQLMDKKCESDSGGAEHLKLSMKNTSKSSCIHV